MNEDQKIAWVNSTSDFVFSNAGNHDTVLSSVSWNLGTSGVSILELSGTGNINGTGSANADNRLVFGAALAVHALMVVVALGTALVFSLIVRPARASESQT